MLTVVAAEFTLRIIAMRVDSRIAMIGASHSAHDDADAFLVRIGIG